MRKGELTLRVLEIIIEIAALPAERLASIITGEGYSRSLNRAIYNLGNHSQFSGREGRKEYFKNLRQIDNILYKLKKNKIIKQDGLLPILTNEGKYFLKELKGDLYKGYLPSVNTYQKERGRSLKLVIFDILEKDKDQRIWLRQVLFRLGYRMLQKSVWWGTGKIPTQLILDLKRLNLLNDHVHIFTIKGKGTLKS